jgi:hypothetical protein
MTLSERILEELEQRLTVLPQSVEEWLRRARAAEDGWGLHLSQIQALRLTVEGLQQRQKEQFARLKAPQPAQFTDNYYSLLREMVAAQELWRVFSSLLGQRESQRESDGPAGGIWRRFRRQPGARKRRPLLDSADLIAADCYNEALKLPREEWKILASDSYREPPLVYWEAGESPVTAPRGMAVMALDRRLAVSQYRHQRLPVPVIALPYDYAACIWLFAFLAHEVGHDLDQDLGLGQPLAEQIAGAIPDGSSDRRGVWRQWAGEVLADAVGVLFGGLGFALALADLLRTIAPLSSGEDLRGAHPPPWLRLHLLVALLRACAVEEWKGEIDRLAQDVAAMTQPTTLAAYQNDVETIAETCYTAQLTPLGGRALCELNPNLGRDAHLVSELTNYLKGQPVKLDAEEFPPRLIPGAARLALSSPGDAPRVHEQALKFFDNYRAPLYQRAARSRVAYYQQLVRELRCWPVPIR